MRRKERDLHELQGKMGGNPLLVMGGIEFVVGCWYCTVPMYAGIRLISEGGMFRRYELDFSANYRNISFYCNST